MGTRADWENMAKHMIEKSDGKKDPVESLLDAIDQYIDEKLNMFGHTLGLFNPGCDPNEGIEYARLRMKTALVRILKEDAE